jgi:hypothetical protein
VRSRLAWSVSKRRCAPFSACSGVGACLELTSPSEGAWADCPGHDYRRRKPHGRAFVKSSQPRNWLAWQGLESKGQGLAIHGGAVVRMEGRSRPGRFAHVPKGFNRLLKGFERHGPKWVHFDKVGEGWAFASDRNPFAKHDQCSICPYFC